jgi:MoaA/NifB/PqqE/SkfB family radical SAM enzyme
MPAGDLLLDGNKLAWHRDRVEAWLGGERIAPVTIDLALTRACNFDCVYCYRNLQANNGGTPTKAQWLQFVEDAAAVGVKALSFVSDGESTTFPGYADIIHHAKVCGLDVALGTNGVLLRHLDDETFVRLMSDLTYLRFNISAGEPARYAEIHGTSLADFTHLRAVVKSAVAVRDACALPVTIGLQMVLMPEFADQILPFARLGVDLGVDYALIKHCSDDTDHTLGVDYGAYTELVPLLAHAQEMSTKTTRIAVKWSKILAGANRCYKSCYGAPFLMQLSGSGLVAPCGMLFNSRYEPFHIGDLKEQRFRDIFYSDRYGEVMDALAAPEFDTSVMCGTLCLQDSVNQTLWNLTGGCPLPEAGPTPPHVNFL